MGRANKNAIPGRGNLNFSSAAGKGKGSAGGQGACRKAEAAEPDQSGREKGALKKGPPGAERRIKPCGNRSTKTRNLTGSRLKLAISGKRWWGEGQTRLMGKAMAFVNNNEKREKNQGAPLADRGRLFSSSVMGRARIG